MTPPTPPSSGASTAVNRKRVLGISAAALLLTGTGILIANRGTGGTDSGTTESGTETSEAAPTTPLPEDIDVAGKVTDTMSFEQAFAAARDEVGMGGVFSWHGRWYNTLHKEEWSSLSLEQRQEFLEHITQEKLPVKPFHQPQSASQGANDSTTSDSEPALIEGHLNGQRVMGLDFDHDGVIDTVVLEGADGNVYRVVDAQGDDGLDTVFRYDALTDELTAVVRLDEPIMLSVDQFDQGLEESMSKEVVDSILESDVMDSPAVPADAVTNEYDDTDDTDQQDMPYDASDDTYVNDGNVDDMDDHRA